MSFLRTTQWGRHELRPTATCYHRLVVGHTCMVIEQKRGFFVFVDGLLVTDAERVPVIYDDRGKALRAAEKIAEERALVTAADARAIDLDKHMKFQFYQDGVLRDAIYFNSANLDLPNPPWDIAFHIDRNEFRGLSQLSITIQAVRKAGG